MRICEYCGAEIPDGELICPNCHKEVQLVPNYETMESRVWEEEKKRREEEQRRIEEQKRREQIAEEARRKRRTRRKIIWIIVASAIAVTLIVVLIRYNSTYNSYSYQYQNAEKAYQDKDYQSALGFIERALQLKSKDPDAGYLEGEIYEASGDIKKAISAYADVTGWDAGYTKAYEKVVPLLVSEKDYDQLQDVLSNIKDDSLKEQYADYFTYEPEFSLKQGTYSSSQRLTLKSDGDGSIYYTTDGSDPDSSSHKYTGAIRLGEGKTTVKAVYISPKDIPGDIVSNSYQITLAKAAAPTITPASGTYSSTGDMKITVEVPDGYTCYYAFDTKATKNSTRYTGPVSMRTGTHVFYAVLVSKEGKTGDVASATYVYSQRAEPTPEPTQSLDADSSPDSEEVTPTPTPTQPASNNSSGNSSGEDNSDHNNSSGQNSSDQNNGSGSQTDNGGSEDSGDEEEWSYEP